MDNEESIERRDNPRSLGFCRDCKEEIRMYVSCNCLGNKLEQLEKENKQLKRRLKKYERNTQSKKRKN